MSEHTLTVLLVPDCPHAAHALDLAQQALVAIGLNATIETLEINDQAQADRLQFAGSPSFHLDGTDLFPTNSPPAIACRVYPTTAGLSGTPDLRDLTDALNAASH
ncbi:hypothetical protein H9623_00020 [Oerskovia sp. Sa1BUA8]|uniref:Thioredoxin family protein n=1 Tax=Oerskovia douganii TaxID=2762210 RepID=A0A9D5YXA7_9CELL|nr:hypothetical protein [Oerskovia douganii]MBE7698692.1 hypothetical protein [Oerskovia douganii]